MWPKIAEGLTTKKVSLQPLSAEADLVALNVARYRMHVRSAIDSESAIRNIVQQLQEIDQKRAELNAYMSQMRDAALTFTAEAREQVRVLMTDYGLTQEEVDALTQVPESIAAIRVDVMAPSRFRQGTGSGNT